MIIDNFQVWRIAIGDILPQCKDSWTKQGFEVNHFEAITPATMPNFLKFGTKDRLVNSIKKNKLAEFTETEKAIWYSHFTLWKKCLDSNTPFVIIEQDNILTEKFPTTWRLYRLKYFCQASKPDRYSPTKKRKFTPAAGYVLTPEGAEFIINHTLNKPEQQSNVDHMISTGRDRNPRSWCIKYAEQYDDQFETIEHDEWGEWE